MFYFRNFHEYMKSVAAGFGKKESDIESIVHGSDWSLSWDDFEQMCTRKQTGLPLSWYEPIGIGIDFYDGSYARYEWDYDCYSWQIYDKNAVTAS